MELQSFGTDHLTVKDTIELRSPSDQRKVVGVMPVCPEKLLETVVDEAIRAQADWAHISVSERINHMKQIPLIIENHSNELVELLKLEQEMLDSVVRREVNESANQTRHYLSVAPRELECIQYEDQEFQATVRKVPYGLVGAIVPWNAPISLATAKVIPALLAGNAVIVKPSHRAPIGATYLLNLFKAVLPSGLVNVLHGLDQLGQAIINHPKITKISFTGSTKVGKQVAQSAGLYLKSVHLELGGNDAAIVLPDADIDLTASRIIESAFRRSGQFCYATKRVYVHSTLKEQFVEALKRQANTLKMGPVSDRSTTLGPVIDKVAQDRLKKLTEEAYLANAIVEHCGTTLDSADLVNGCYVQPTLIWKISHSHPLVVEEQFGPVLPILSFERLDTLINEINNQEYGLSGSLWGSDLSKLQAFAKAISVGRIFVNSARAMGDFSGKLPAGGHRQSGLGWEKSVFGLREYYQYQTINGPRF